MEKISLEAEERGAMTWQQSLRSHKVTYIDASKFIKWEAYGKGGKAHSDIYSKEIAALIRESIQSIAP